MYQFIEMFESLPPKDLGETEFPQSTSLREDSLVSLTAWLANGLRLLMKETFGMIIKDCFAKLGQHGEFSKMFQGYCQARLDGSLPEFCETWPQSGLMRGGLLFRLPPWGQRRKDGGSISWPTVTNCGNYNRKGSSAKSGDGLATVVGNWPTPTVPNGGRKPKGGMSLTGMTPDGKKRQVDLNYAVKHWPTPAGRDGIGGKTGFKNQPCLPNAVANWPTATARDFKSGKGKTQKERGRSAGPSLSESCQGSLNADWVEILMGYPIGWTDIECDTPEPWAGWPMGQGEAQHDYEPPRTMAGQKHRTKRLKCLGNAIVPQAAFPLFKLIMEVEQNETNSRG